MDSDKKKKLSLNIISNNPGSKHRSFGAGMIDLSNLSSIIIDGDEAYIDVGDSMRRAKWKSGSSLQPTRMRCPTVVNAGSYGWLWIAMKKERIMRGLQPVRC